MKNLYYPVIISYIILFSVIILGCNRFTEVDDKKGPSDWFISQRIYPYGKVDYLAYQNSITRRAEMIAAGTQRDDLLWLQEGPINIGGRVQDIEMDPADTSIIYVGAASGGIFKSQDGGLNWVSIFDEQPSLSIGDIAVAPSDPNIIFAGTGEPNCGGGSVTYDGMGVFKSTDAGLTWNYSGLDSTRNTGRIVIDPNDPQRIYIATMGDLFANTLQRGVYRSDNGGDTWERILFVSDSTGAIDLIINPLHPDTIYACMWERVRRPTYEHYGGVTCGIYRSYDGGDTWTQLIDGLPVGFDVGRIGIDISQSNPDILYAIYADKTGYFDGIYKTLDNGDSWIQTNDASLGSIFASYGWWFGRIKVDPTDENTAYALGFDEAKTSNGGSSWNISSGGMHVDHHTMFIHPLNPNLIYDGNDGGIYKSTDASSSWTHIKQLPITQFYTSEINYNSSEELYGGTQDNNVIRTLTGSVDDWESIIGGDGFYVLVDPENPNYIYAESQYGALNRSVNGGNTFFGATNGISQGDRKNWNTPVVFNPLNPQSLYYGSNKMYKSENRAENWDVVSGDLTNGPGGGNITFGTITTISVSPVDTNIVYAGTDDGNVWISINNCINWTNISSAFPNRWVTRITCDPADAQRAYVTFSGYRFDDDMAHVYMTTDAGQSWANIAGDLPDVPANDVLADPLLDSTLYLATDVAVFFTNNFGNTWSLLGTGLPIVPITDLTFHEPTRTLLAATYGRSMYSVGLEFFSSNPASPLLINDISIFPNPVDDILNLKFTTPNSCIGAIEIYDQKGELLFVEEKYFNKGLNTISWNSTFMNKNHFHPGIYFLKIQGGSVSGVKKFSII